MKVLSFLKLLITAVEFVLIYDIIGVNSSNAYASKVRLKSVSPPSGGVNGGTQMIIIGSGFALNQFNFGEGNSHLGNEIIFYSSTRTYICDINQYGCTSTRLECFTRPMVEGYYLLQLKIDGNDIPLEQTNNTAFYVRSAQTPTIHKLEPVFTVPQSLLTLSGRLFTDRYGNNVATASNGRSESIQRVYIGGNKCELLRPDIPDTLYGLKLINTNTYNNEGTMKCKMEGTYVGPQNISFIVDGPYGRSKPTIETMHIMPGDKIAMVLTYPEIDSIDKHSGGIAGGTNLVVTGKNFDKANTNVFIDGHECETTSVTQWEIQCSTPPKPNLNSTPSIFPGEVGLLLEKWNNFTSSVGIEDIYKLTEDHPGYSFHHINEFHYTTSDENTVVRLTGFFLPPKDAMYSFKYRSHYFQHVAIFFSGDQFPENVEQLNGNNVFELHKGQRYFIQLVGQHKNRPGYISLDIYSPTASYLHSQTVDVVQEQQKIRFDSEQKSEIQTFEFVSIESQNSTNSTNSTNEIQKITVTGNGDGYLLSFDNVWTGKISLYDSPSDIENKLNKLSSIKPDTVSVTTGDGEEDSGLSYLVEFNTKRGDVKLITAKALNPGLYVNITEIIPGVSSLEMIQLSLNDVVTEQFDVDAPLTAVQRAIENLFRPICEEEVIKPEYAVFASDFESSFPSSYYLGSTYTGDSYCGLKSSRNAHKIVVSGTEREFDVDPIGTYVCFAYRAIGKSIIQPDVRFYFTGTKFAADGKQIITHKTVKIYFDFINDDRWHYLCKNVYEDIMMESDVIYDSMHVYDAIIYFKGSWLLDTLSILHQSEKPFIFENGTKFILVFAN